MNRPKRMTKLVAVRFTPQEVEEIRELADKSGYSISEILRRSFREAVWRERYTKGNDDANGA